jgi:hypothetical protein
MLPAEWRQVLQEIFIDEVGPPVEPFAPKTPEKGTFVCQSVGSFKLYFNRDKPCHIENHTKVIAAIANEAPHVLDGLLYHQSSLVINEHYTDTGGFSDHVFAMCRLLGFRFAPRIRDLNEKRLYLLPGMTVPPEFASLVAGTISVRAITDHWFELLRLAMSIKTGTVTASVILRKARGLSPAERSGPRAARTGKVGTDLLYAAMAARPGTASS